MNQMRAATFDAERISVQIENVPIPQLEPDELLVRVSRCGICGSDVSMTEDSPFTMGERFGHEYAGEVVEIGGEVTSFAPGDRVAGLPIVPCGSCEFCLREQHFFCSSPADGMVGFAEYVALPERGAVKLPSSLDVADGALVEPMACGLHAMRLADEVSGQRVLVLGGGSMALSAIFWARQLGAGRIVALSRSRRRDALIGSLGADVVLGFDQDASVIEEELGGPPDIIVEAVGKEGMIELAIKMIRACGTVLSMGMSMRAEAILPAECNFKEIRLFFPVGYSKVEFIETAEAFGNGRLRAGELIGGVISLESLPAQLDLIRESAGSPGKFLVDPTRA